MATEKKLKMCPDPECGKESPEDSESCIGCGIDFNGFDMFDKFLTVRERRQAEVEKNKNKNKPVPKKQSLLDALRRRK